MQNEVKELEQSPDALQILMDIIMKQHHLIISALIFHEGNFQAIATEHREFLDTYLIQFFHFDQFFRRYTEFLLHLPTNKEDAETNENLLKA